MIALIDGDVLFYMAMWEAESKEHARENFDSLFTSITESLFVDDYAMAIGNNEGSNFRYDIYDKYKANRTKSKSERPEWFYDLKSDIVNDYDGCIFADYCEADDLIRIWANQIEDYIVVSVDKDLDCIKGKHYNPRKDLIYTIQEEDANYNYWKQIIMGDSTDNIPGVPGIGPKKAEKLLLEEPPAVAACKAYEKHYGEEGYNYLLANGKLIHILRTPTDYFNFSRTQYDQSICG
jgi:DNA polymerase-1